MRNFNIVIKPWDQSGLEASEVFEQLDKGIFPEQPIERVCFNNIRTFLKYITPRRYELLERLYANGATSVSELSKLLNRNYKNVFDDLKLLEQIGLVEKDEHGFYSVPWDEVSASFRLAA